MIHAASTGTSVTEAAYEAVMAKSTARDSGMNKARASPSKNSAGVNTAAIHRSASKRGGAVSRLPSTTARDTRTPKPRRVWIFSISTVASSTRIPIAKANPPNVMRLSVCPHRCNPRTAASKAIGMVATTTSAPRQLRRKTSTIMPVRIAPKKASCVNESSAAVTSTD